MRGYTEDYWDLHKITGIDLHKIIGLVIVNDSQNATQEIYEIKKSILSGERFNAPLYGVVVASGSYIPSVFTIHFIYENSYTKAIDCAKCTTKLTCLVGV